MSWHLAGALRELRPLNSGPAAVGSAFLIGASKDFPLFGRTVTLLAQGGGTRGIPVYIGSQIDSNDVIRLLTGDQIVNGWSVLASLSTRWTGTIATSTYVSRFSLRVPYAGAPTGTVDILRLGANLTWQPSRTTKFGVEAGWALGRVVLPQVAPNGARMRGVALEIFAQKNF